MDPITASLIISAIGSGLGAAGAAAGGSAQAEANQRIAAMNNQAAGDRQTQQTGLAESMVDPFRQQMFQASDLGRLGMMMAPPRSNVMGPSGGYGRAGGMQSPGQGFTPSPELIAWLSQLQQNIAAGQNQAPTMTNPANYGQTAAMYLTGVGDPRQAMGANRRPPPVSPYGGGGPGDPFTGNPSA